MPASRPRRVHTIIIIILMGPRAQQQLDNHIEDSAEERMLINLTRVFTMFEHETDTTIDSNAAMTTVVNAFESAADYIEGTDDPSKLQSLSDSLGDALDDTDY